MGKKEKQTFQEEINLDDLLFIYCYYKVTNRALKISFKILNIVRCGWGKKLRGIFYGYLFITTTKLNKRQKI